MKILRRLDRARVVRGGGALTLVHADGSASRLEGASAALGEAVLDLFDDGPRTRDEVVAAIEEQAEERAQDGPPQPGHFDVAVIDELLAVLERAGVVGAAREAEAPSPDKRASGLRVVLGVTGAVQAMDAPRVVRLLQDRGFVVRVVATQAAQRFVSFPVLAALTHRRPIMSLWGAADGPAAHVDLAAWAEVVLIYPASGTTISRIARGDFSDVVAATALTTRAPVILAPSMNVGMLRAPAVARNLATLREDGFFLVDPSLGIEVADPPAERTRRVGATIAPEQIVDVVALLARRRVAAPPPIDDWERVYAGDARPSWHVDAVPADLAAALAALPPPRALLDVGTGLGTVAIHAAERGYRVVATDVAASALSRASLRAAHLPITFVRDDVKATRLVGAFDVVVDRGCLHTLVGAARGAYAASISRLVRPGGALLLVTDDVSARADRATSRLAPAEVAIELPMFDLERATPTTLALDDPGTAWLSVLRRR